MWSIVVASISVVRSCLPQAAIALGFGTALINFALAAHSFAHRHCRKPRRQR